MSAQFQPFDSAYWMQSPAHHNPSQQLYNNDFSDAFSFDQAPRQWQPAEQDNRYPQFYVNHPTPPPHLTTPQRRALSSSTNSTTASLASVRSPYLPGTPLPHQQTFDQPTYFDTRFDASYLPPPPPQQQQQNQQQQHFFQSYHHLPTPSHTPTQEYYMADGRIVSRRRSAMENSESVQAAHKALRPLLIGHSSSIGDFAPEVPSTPRGTSQDQSDDHLNVLQQSSGKHPSQLC